MQALVRGQGAFYARSLCTLAYKPLFVCSRAYPRLPPSKMIVRKDKEWCDQRDQVGRYGTIGLDAQNKHQLNSLGSAPHQLQTQRTHGTAVTAPRRRRRRRRWGRGAIWPPRAAPPIFGPGAAVAQWGRDPLLSSHNDVVIRDGRGQILLAWSEQSPRPVFLMEDVDNLTAKDMRTYFLENVKVSFCVPA